MKGALTQSDVNRRRSLTAVVLLVPAPTIGTIMGMIVAPGWVGQTIFLICKAWLILLPVIWLLFVDRGKLSLSPVTDGGFGVATVLGLAIVAVIFVAYHLFGQYWIDASRVREMAIQNGIGTVPVYIGMAVYWITINSLLEEYVWRWFVVHKWESVVRPDAAIVLSAVCFTMHHVVALKVQFDWRVTVLGSLGVFVGGVVWSWLYVRYRSIWPCYVSHALVDVPIFVIGWWLIFG